MNLFKNFGWVTVCDCMIIVHSKDNPLKSEWKQWVKAYKKEKPSINLVLSFWLVNAAMRNDIYETLGQDKCAGLCPNNMIYTTAQAMKPFMNFNGFMVQDIDKALEWLNCSTAEQKIIKKAHIELCKKVLTEEELAQVLAIYEKTIG